MEQEVISWLLALPLLGFVTGLRTFTPMAVLCWFAYAGQLSVDGTWAAWTENRWVAIAFTVLALAEYVGDKLPQIPDRVSPGPLAARLFFGGLMGAIVAVGLNGASLEGGLLGVIGALIGAFSGYHFRREIVARSDMRDWNAALVEDVIAVGCAILAVSIVTS